MDILDYLYLHMIHAAISFVCSWIKFIATGQQSIMFMESTFF